MSSSIDIARRTSPEGLATGEAAGRLRDEGPNELPSAPARSPLRIVREVLSEPMFMLLAAAGFLYLLLGDLAEAIALMLFANLSISIAVLQEFRSEKVLQALRELSSPKALVVRDGRQQSVPGRDVVRGDLLLLGEGERVPADVVLVDGEGLEVDESLLTGESVPVRKRVLADDDAERAAPGGDDLPFLYSGTLLVRGAGRAVAVATGAHTEIGRIGGSLAAIVVEPPRLQAQTRRLVRMFGSLAIAMSTVVVVLYSTLRGSLTEGLLAGIAVGMTLLPEEFPLVLTVFMVMGAWRISRARVLTRRAAAIESLGAATVLCTDKTGTLTKNRMRVADLVPWAPASSAGPEPARLVEAGLLASSRDALDPMDRAVHERAAEELADVAAFLDGHAVVREFPLSRELLAVVSICEGGGNGGRHGRIAAAKGAPEAVASLCGLEDAERARLDEEVGRLAAAGMRVLAVADAELGSGEVPEAPTALRMRMLGLLAFADPLRDGVPESVAECREAGVRVVMITGDYPATARAIAAEAGIDAGEVLTGAEVAAMDEAERARRVAGCSVFARIQPEQKLELVEALKAAGEVVAMIGDGVNDAPSLRAAHIGIAMGGRGTDVAREASSIVLLDDDFRCIPRTVRLGRRIYDNLRKAMGYVIALHLPIAGLAALPLAFGLPLILTPMIIAFLEMIIDPVCSVVFEAEAEEPDIMMRPPRDPAAALFPPALLAWCTLQGLVALVVVGGVLVSAVRAGTPVEGMRSLVFASLVSTNIALIFANRSFAISSGAALARPNRLLWGAIALALGLLVLVVRWEPLRELFRLGPLGAGDAAFCAAAGALLFVLLQGLKRLWRVPLAA